MPSAALIQSKIDYGYAKAGAVLGTPFGVYRAPGVSNPIAPGNLVATLSAAFSRVPGFKFDRGRQPKDIFWNVLADGTQIQVGDYLVGSLTYFVLSMTPLSPIVAATCTRTVSLFRPAGPPSGATGFGSQPYQEPVAVTDASLFASAPIMASIPVSMQEERLRRDPGAGLPADAANTAGRTVYFSAATFPEGTLRSRDYLVDENGTRYQMLDPFWDVIGYRASVTILEV